MASGVHRRGAAGLRRVGPVAGGARVTERETSPIRVVHFAARLPVGGMENVVACLFRRLPSSQFASTIWCLEERDALGDELVREGHSILEFRRARRRDPLMFFRVAHA